MVVILLILAGLLLLPACNTADTTDAAAEQPAMIEPIEGTELNRVILTEKAAERLDIQTAQVREEQVDDVKRLAVPYSALIYDLEGATWMYTSPAPLTYVREAIDVDYIDGDMVILKDGPATGTEVVTVGVAELYGADTGIGK
jgi:multidrug efflux pump subunit AcrA (membrane-fusion protein)